MIKTFQDLEVWKKGHTLVLNIYKTTGTFPTEERYGLISQTQRAAVSVTSNIAEGFHRYFWKDRIRFYYQSRASLSEVENLIIIAKDLSLITVQDFDNLIEQIRTVQAILYGLIEKSKQFSQ